MHRCIATSHWCFGAVKQITLALAIIVGICLQTERAATPSQERNFVWDTQMYGLFDHGV
jgi:hypothetical protein